MDSTTSAFINLRAYLVGIGRRQVPVVAHVATEGDPDLGVWIPGVAERTVNKPPNYITHRPRLDPPGPTGYMTT